jgi:hypothetical protein
MDNYTTVLMPCRGNLLNTVWLPASREVDPLVVNTLSYVPDTVQRVRRKAEAWGLSPESVQKFCLGQYGGLRLSVWLCWVPRNRQPSGLQEVEVAAVQEHAVFGRIVREIRAAQAAL